MFLEITKLWSLFFELVLNFKPILHITIHAFLYIKATFYEQLEARMPKIINDKMQKQEL